MRERRDAGLVRAGTAICDSSEVIDRGSGMRFSVEWHGGTAAAFVVRRGGEISGFLNRCTHVAMELDWRPGEFFDPETGRILCATHGAEYDARDGRCLGGPCRGRNLVRLNVEERSEGESEKIFYLGEGIHDE